MIAVPLRSSFDQRELAIISSLRSLPTNHIRIQTSTASWLNLHPEALPLFTVTYALSVALDSAVWKTPFAPTVVVPRALILKTTMLGENDSRGHSGSKLQYENHLA
jgi:hypothetical protein